jgi:aryl-alcohol dehydrogenase-like predicted oxidoreductase
MYQDSEDLLGQWFKQNPGKRENIFLATKFANAMKEDGTRYVDSCKKSYIPILHSKNADKFNQHPSTAAKHANAHCSASA